MSSISNRSGFFNTVVIGGGQAGLAAAYYLKKRNKDFVILEATAETGHSWKGRYESLRLFTSARYNGLPGLPFPGDPGRFPGKDEVGDYLKNYAASFKMPILFNTRVTSVKKDNGHFLVQTNGGAFISKNVIVCTGAFQKPFMPSFSGALNRSIRQLHSSAYQRPGQLKPGNTLVVGGGNSGVQIVEELLKVQGNIYFSFSGKLKAMPNGRLTQLLIFGCGIASASIKSPLGEWMKSRPEPVIGTDLRKLYRSSNLRLVGRTRGASEDEIYCEDAALDSVQNIIWATGFRPDFTWINADIFNEAGYPETSRGVTRTEGLYFLGLPWMHSRSSGLLCGVGKDARYIVNYLD